MYPFLRQIFEVSYFKVLKARLIVFEFVLFLVIGGLLSAHLLSYRLYLEPNSNTLNVSKHLDPEWPCNGPLLKLAVNFADKLLPGKLEYTFNFKLFLVDLFTIDGLIHFVKHSTQPLECHTVP
jgi:hypothetical protein